MARMVTQATSVVMLTALLTSGVRAQFEPPPNARVIDDGPLSERQAGTLGQPLYRVGWAGSGHEFAFIESGVLLPDGSAAVLDGPPYELVVLDPVGHVRHVIGRKGQGPGEFEFAVAVTLRGADTLVVEDDNNRRLSYFVDGELVGDAPYDGGAFMGLGHVGLGWYRGDLVLSNYAVPSPLPTEWFRGAFVRHRPGSDTFDTVSVFPLARQFSDSHGINPFRSSGVWTYTEGAVASAWSNRPQIVRVPLNGSQPLVIKWLERHPVVTDSLWKLHVAYETSRFGSNASLRIGRRSDVRGPLPLIGALHGDHEGRIWASEWSPDRSYPRYRLFGVTGDWLGWVKGTAGLRILDVDANRVLAVEKNKYDVQAVVVLPIVWSDGSS